MSLNDKINQLLNEDAKSNSASQKDISEKLKENEFSKAEIEFWNKKRYKDDLQKIEFILQNQEKVPGRVIVFSLEQLEDMKSDELQAVFYEIHSGLGLEEAPKEEKKEFLDNRPDQINFILTKEKDLISPEHWFKSVMSFHDISDSEVERLYKRMAQMLKLTVKELEGSLTENSGLEEKHLRNRKEKIHYILQQQSQIYKDPRDTFSDEDLALFSDKYINKLYHQIEKSFLTKVGLSEDVDWDEVGSAMTKRDFQKVAYLFDTTTKLGAEQIVDSLLSKGYSNADVKEVVREIFGGQDVPEYFEHKLNTNPSSEFQNLDDTTLNEDGTTADVAVPSLAVFGTAKDKKNDTWAESVEDDFSVSISGMDKITGSEEWESTVKGLQKSGWPLAIDDIEKLQNGETITLCSPNGRRVIGITKKEENIAETGAFGATMNQTDLTPDPVELEKDKNIDDTLYESVKTIDFDKLKLVYENYVAEVLDKTMGDVCTDSTHREIKEYLSKYASKSLIEENLKSYEAEEFKHSGEWNFESFKRHIGEHLNQKKSTVSNEKGKVFDEKPIFKNNKAEKTHQTVLTNKSMANESRYPVQESDLKLLQEVAAPLEYEILAVRGALLESGREDQLEIVVEKHSTRALVEYSDNAAKPFQVEGKQFTTLPHALSFISENADRFTTEATETSFNEEGKNRAIKEAKELEVYTQKAIDSYKKERARFEGREIEIMKSIMTEAQLKRGFNGNKK